MYKKLVLLMALVLMSRGVQAACDRTGDQINVNCWDCAADDGTSVCEARLSGTTLTVSGTGEMKDYERFYGQGYQTTAPWGRIGVTDLVVENGITVLGAHSFEDMKTLTNVSFPLEESEAPTLLAIKTEAFHDCANLQEISLPDSVQIIEEIALAAQGLAEINLSEDLREIASMALAYTSIRTLVIPPLVETLPNCLFGGCRSGWKLSDVENLYCTSAQMQKCEAALVTNNSDFKPTRYEKEGNNYLVYDDKGNVVGKYANITALNKGTATETYKYDSAGHLTSIFDGNGQRTWGKKIYTVEEAMESTAKGDRFHVSLTYK